MFKAQLKFLDGKKWKLVNIEELKGKSVLQYMINTDKTCIAALLEDDKAVLFLSNEMEQVRKYKEKGISLHTSDMLMLMGSDAIPDVMVRVFPDATFESIATLIPEEEKDWKKWWN